MSSSKISSGEVGNIVGLEHVNVCVADQQTAFHFYVEGLGFVRDKEYQTGLENMWVNLGPTQFHLPIGTPQVLRGHVGVVVPDREALLRRLAQLEEDLGDSDFEFSDSEAFVDVTSPWGNHFRVFEPATVPSYLGAGIGYVEFDVPIGVGAGIAEFYREMLGTSAVVEGEAGHQIARCVVGQGQSLAFRETEQPIAPYDGHHVQIYVADIAGPRARLAPRGLVYEDHDPNQFRFKDIIDLESGAVLYEIEHEVRSTSHPMFGRL